MASTISAGITTTTALSYSADTSGVLQLQTNGGTTALTLDTSQNATFAGKVASASSLQLATNGTTTAVTIDTNQNFGLGVTPSTFTGLGATVFESNGGATAYRGVTSGVEQYTNTYFSSGFLYKASGYATRFTTATGAFTWYTAPSGTAGNAITFTQAMTLNASGNLGLGVTPSAWQSIYTVQQIGAQLVMYNSTSYNGWGANFYVDSTGTGRYIQTDYATIYQQNRASGIHAWYIAPSGTAGNAITFTQAMTLDNSGKLLVGLTSAGSFVSNLIVNRQGVTNSPIFSWTNSTTNSGHTYVFSNNGAGVSADGYLAFGSNEGGAGTFTERMRIDTSGNLLVGTTSQLSSALLSVNGSSNGVTAKVSTNSNSVFVGQNSSGSVTFNVNGTGQINSVFTSINAISDARLKTNIQTIKYGLAVVTALKPVMFDFIENDLVQGQSGNLGFIAQDVQSVIPELVVAGSNKAEDGSPYLTLKMGDMLPVLVKAIQELSAQVTTLQTQVTALKG